MSVITRADAKAKGLDRYFTGKPCAKGHIESRNVRNGTCRECMRLATLAYRTKNPAAAAESKKKSRERNPGVAVEYSRRYYAENRETAAVKRKQYYDDNKEASSEYSRLYLQRNREAQLGRMREYRLANPHMKVAHEAKRRARKALAIPAWFGEFDAFVWMEAAALAHLRQLATGIGWHADHMIPLLAKTASGLHVGANCQVIPAILNNRKYNKMILTEPFEWIRHL